MNTADLLSQRECVALLAKQGCVLSPHTLVGWRRDPKIGFPAPRIKAVRALLFAPDDVLAWFAQFKKTERYRTFLYRVALRNGSQVVREQLAPAKIAKPAKPRKVRAHAEAA